MPDLRVVEPARVDPKAKARAYAIAAEGFRRALDVPGLAEKDAARLTRCYRNCRRIQGVPGLIDAGAA